jgi:hypothetical protein
MTVAGKGGRRQDDPRKVVYGDGARQWIVEKAYNHSPPEFYRPHGARRGVGAHPRTSRSNGLA